jgi:hypothetical protein
MRTRIGSLALLWCCPGLGTAACSGPSDGDDRPDVRGDADGRDAPADDGADPGEGEGGEGTDAADVDGETPVPPGARLHGTVWGPHPDDVDPLFPVSGALIAAYVDPPDEIPDGVYCDECVELPPEVVWTTSAPDGTFGLTVQPGAHYYLATQKGQFRRVWEYDAPATGGDYDLDPEMTTLPHRTDRTIGDTIPNIAVLYGDYDHIEDVLAKVGIGEDDDAYGYDYEQTDPPFDMYDNGNEEHHGARRPDLLGTVEAMSRYHVIFFNCSYNAIFSFMGQESLQQRLRDYVSAGGKLYVSDYAMPVVEKPWPDFIWFTDPLWGGCNEADTDPPSCNHGPPFHSPSEPLDEGLHDWLEAQGLLADGFETRENWDTIGGLFEGEMGTDPDTGLPVRGLPYVWVEGPWNYTAENLEGSDYTVDTWDYETKHPMTVSFQYGCGRVLFTTYHTVGGTGGGRHPGLLDQELTLFYLIMEIGVCQDVVLI